MKFLQTFKHNRTSGIYFVQLFIVKYGVLTVAEIKMVFEKKHFTGNNKNNDKTYSAINSWQLELGSKKFQALFDPC